MNNEHTVAPKTTLQSLKEEGNIMAECCERENDCTKEQQEQMAILIEKAFAAGREEAVARVRKHTAESRRKYLHQVVESGSQEHLNDVWREGYNNALVDLEERMDVMFGEAGRTNNSPD